MTNELIKIATQTINGEENQTVNARELHEFLGSKQEYASWIKARIEQYGFIENQDFVVFDNFIKNPQGGRPAGKRHGNGVPVMQVKWSDGVLNLFGGQH